MWTGRPEPLPHQAALNTQVQGNTRGALPEQAGDQFFGRAGADQRDGLLQVGGKEVACGEQPAQFVGSGQTIGRFEGLNAGHGARCTQRGDKVQVRLEGVNPKVETLRPAVGGGQQVDPVGQLRADHIRRHAPDLRPVPIGLHRLPGARGGQVRAAQAGQVEPPAFQLLQRRGGQVGAHAGSQADRRAPQAHAESRLRAAAAQYTHGCLPVGKDDVIDDDVEGDKINQGLIPFGRVHTGWLIFYVQL